MRIFCLPFLSIFVSFSSTSLLANIVDELQIDPSYKIEVYASGLDSPRQLAESMKGRIFVGSRRGGKIFAIRDTDGNERWMKGSW